MRRRSLTRVIRRTAASGGLWFAALAASGCESGSAPPDRIPATFPGLFLLQTIDGSALPTGIAFLPSGSTMLVGHGELSFESPPGQLKFSALGSVNGSPIIVANLSHAFAVGDSFIAVDGWRGRVWGDTAELRTTGTSVGEHRWRFERPSTSP